MSSFTDELRSHVTKYIDDFVTIESRIPFMDLKRVGNRMRDPETDQLVLSAYSKSFFVNKGNYREILNKELSVLTHMMEMAGVRRGDSVKVVDLPFAVLGEGPENTFVRLWVDFVKISPNESASSQASAQQDFRTDQ